MRLEDLRRVYAARFAATEARRQVVWAALCRYAFQTYVPTNGTVLDLGAGTCDFINHISARRRIAVDMLPSVLAHAADGVEAFVGDARALTQIPDESVDLVFSSNFFEHLPDVDALLDVLTECHRTLTEAGSLVVLMPNARNIPGPFWDFLDHRLPLTDRSLCEALRLRGFVPTLVRPRWLPYTMQGNRVPVRGWFVRAYLAFPPLWRIFGKQMLVVAEKER